MLIREQPATELTLATRILARADALHPDGRITVRLNEVMYLAGRGAANNTMTPFDVAAVLLADGSGLAGEPPADVETYLAAHRANPSAGSVARSADGELVAARTLRTCVAAVLRRVRGGPELEDDATIERLWVELVADARIAGALIGAFPTDETPPGR